MSTVFLLCQDVADELSLERPVSIVGNTENDEAQKVLRHLTRTCRQLSARYDWSVLRREKVLTTTATEEQTGAIPADMLRFVQTTMFNRTTRRGVEGPLNSQEWQEQKAVSVAGLLPRFYMRGRSLLFYPAPGDAQTIAFEYITNFIGVDDVGSTERTTFLADNDSPYLDDELLILGTVWRYRKADGLDYSEEFMEYERRFSDLIKMDGGRRRVDMSDPPTDRQIRTPMASVDDLTTI